MNRVNRIVNQMELKEISEETSDDITSLDIFTYMNAILNGNAGGSIDESSLRNETKLRLVFEKLDLNNSGDLDRSEFMKACRLCSMIVTEEEINGIYDKISHENNNTSGTIRFPEFSAAIHHLLDSFITINNEDFTKLDDNIKTVIALWDEYMNNNKMASHLFTRKLLKDEEMVGELRNVDIGRQMDMVYGMISNSIRGLIHEERLVERLEKEGARHYYAFNMTERHYHAVRKALFETLPVVMGKDYTDNVKGLYEKYWDIIEGAMIKGLKTKR